MTARPMTDGEMEEWRRLVDAWDARPKVRGREDPATIRLARALLSTSSALRGMREALERIANLEIDISFMADHLIWAKGLAREALSPKEGG